MMLPMLNLPNLKQEEMLLHHRRGHRVFGYLLEIASIHHQILSSILILLIPAPDSEITGQMKKMKILLLKNLQHQR
ncbi:hypothetical protein B0H10DRAFT_1931222 [Mycena sp. CBHHK59/15]|nr:hypothetical protein B0H10DRAFT_1931222 [Mycena sp. CBHHK59/15]